MDPYKTCGLISSSYDGKQINLQDAQIYCEVISLASNVTATLTYCNQFDEPVDSKFVFPLLNLVIYAFEAHINNRVIVAECRPREEAQKTFEEAVESGHTAFLAEQDERSEDIFQISLGNIPPKETVKIILKYAGNLLAENICVDDVQTSQAVFILPSVINPRYTPLTSTIVSEFDPFTVARAANSVPYAVSFEASLHMPGEIVSVLSEKDTYSVDLDKADLKRAKVKLQSKFQFDHDLQMTVKMKQPLTSFLVYEDGDPNKSSILAMDCIMGQFIPDFSEVQSQQERNTEMVFVIDRSGSMSGSSIRSASESLLLFLKALPVGCRFQIIGFGSSYSALFNEPVDYNEQTLERALEYQKSMQADMGGTEVLPALKAALDAPLTGQGWYRQVIFITDGDIGNADEVIGLVGANIHKARVFSIGIKTSSNLINEVSRAGRGVSAFILDESKLRGVVMKILGAALQPRAHSVKFYWDVGSTDREQVPVDVVTLPKQIPPVFHNNFVSVFGLFPNGTLKKLKGIAVLECQVMSKNQYLESSLPPYNLPILSSDAPLHRLAAKCQLNELGDTYKTKLMSGTTKEDSEMKTLQDQIVKISCAANVLSPLTALVGVDPVKREPVLKRSQPMREFREVDPAGCLLWAAVPMAFGSVSHSAVAPRSFLGKCRKSKNAGRIGFFAKVTGSRSPVMDTAVQEPAPKTEVWLSLAELQNISGFWTLDDNLAKTLNGSLSSLQKAKPSNWPSSNQAVKETVWATALVISYLELRASDRKDEWELLTVKARSWLIEEARVINQDTRGAKKLCEDLLKLSRDTIEAIIP